jgi:hypothetical protein
LDGRAEPDHPPVSALAGPLHLVALVLVISGAQKVAAPGPAARAMRDAGLPVPRRGTVVGVVLGVVEAGTGLAVFAAPHAATALWLGAFYVALAAFVVVLRRRDATAGCGCFGASSAPPTTTHVLVNLAAAAVAFGAAAVGVPDIVHVVDEGLGVAVPYAVLVVTGAALVLLAPALLAQIDQTVHGDPPRPFGLPDPRSDRAGALR